MENPIGSLVIEIIKNRPKTLLLYIIGFYYIEFGKELIFSTEGFRHMFLKKCALEKYEMY